MAMSTHSKAGKATAHALRNRKAFGKFGDSMSARVVEAEPFRRQPQGKISPADAQAFGDVQVSYVVYSYSTPIAFVSSSDPSLVVVIDARYSPTTSNHQTWCRRFLAGDEVLP